MKKPTATGSKDKKKQIIRSVAIGSVFGILIAVGAYFTIPALHPSKVSSTYEKAAEGGTTNNSTIPVTKELTSQRLSLTKKIQKMNCNVVNRNASEDKLEFACKYPTAKKYTRQELLDAPNP